MGKLVHRINRLVIVEFAGRRTRAVEILDGIFDGQVLEANAPKRSEKTGDAYSLARVLVQPGFSTWLIGFNGNAELVGSLIPGDRINALGRHVRRKNLFRAESLEVVVPKPAEVGAGAPLSEGQLIELPQAA